MQFKKTSKLVKIEDLQRHPFATETYELNEIESLAENIKRNGIVFGRPLVDEYNNILMGARIIEACKRLG